MMADEGQKRLEMEASNFDGLEALKKAAKIR